MTQSQHRVMLMVVAIVSALLAAAFVYILPVHWD